MRNAIRKGRIVLPGLAAAAFAGWMGAPAAHGDFSVVVVKGSTTGSNTAYELEAQNLGNTTGTTPATVLVPDLTGTALVGWDVAVTMNNESKGFVIQTNVDIDGDGAPFGSGGAAVPNTYRDANLAGNTNDDTYYYSGGQPHFGLTTGTFMGLPNTAKTLSTTPYTSVDTVYINSQVTAHVNQPVWHTFNSSTDVSTPIDSAFTTANGVWSLEIVDASTSGGDADSTGLIPFGNFVVPTGSVFTIAGQVGGNTGNPFVFPTTVVNGSTVTSSSSTLSLSLTNSAPGVGTLIANVTMTGSHTLGYPLQSFAVTGAAQTAGYLAVTGFNPATDVEIYGLDVSGETSLSQLISDLQAQVNAGATVVGTAGAAPGTAGALLAAAGDQIEVTFANSTDTAYFSYNFGSYTTNGTVLVSQVSVIPEPTTIGLLAATGFGLLGRRRRKSISA
jgi:hypothetical protein